MKGCIWASTDLPMLTVTCNACVCVLLLMPSGYVTWQTIANCCSSVAPHFFIFIFHLFFFFAFTRLNKGIVCLFTHAHIHTVTLADFNYFKIISADHIHLIKNLTKFVKLLLYTVYSIYRLKSTDNRMHNT